jgi:hypothetical protein
MHCDRTDLETMDSLLSNLAHARPDKKFLVLHPRCVISIKSALSDPFFKITICKETKCRERCAFKMKYK